VALRVNRICFDRERPALLARFWAAALGYRVREYMEADLESLRAAGISDVEDDPTVAVDGRPARPPCGSGGSPRARS
jgi:hypothetical protein